MKAMGKLEKTSLLLWQQTNVAFLRDGSFTSHVHVHSHHMCTCSCTCTSHMQTHTHTHMHMHMHMHMHIRVASRVCVHADGYEEDGVDEGGLTTELHALFW